VDVSFLPKELKVTLVIPTFNKSSRLKLMLSSLTQVNNIKHTEIIIVNDGSSDNTTELLECFRNKENLELTVINAQNKGRSAARNLGLGVAQGDIIIFTDDDLLLEPAFIDEHKKMHSYCQNFLVHGCIYNLPFLKFFSDPATGEMVDGSNKKEGLTKYLVTPGIVLDKDKSIQSQKRLTAFERDIHDLLNKTNRDEDNFVRWVSCTGGNISIRKDLLEAVGGFDESFGTNWGCEDLELGYRLWLEGVQFEFCSNAVNYHMSHYRDDSAEAHRKAFEHFSGKYKDEKIVLLLEYFEGKIPTLLDWRNRVLIGEK